MSISEAIRNWFLDPVLDKLTKMEAQMASTQTDLDNALTALGTVLANVQTLVTSEDSGIAAIIAAVNALIAKVGTGGDFTNEVTAINSIASQLTAQGQDITTQTASIQTAVAAAKQVTG